MPGVAAGQVYAYRIAGPIDSGERALSRFDPQKVLLDPYGRCIARPAGRSRHAAAEPGDNAATALRSVVTDPAAYDWEGDALLGHPFAKTTIYGKMHVGGFTRHPSSGVAAGQRGTYAGLIEKIPYLRDLEVSSAVELLPGVRVRRDRWAARPQQLLGLPAAIVLCAASRLQFAAGTAFGALDEFRDMVKALHRAGIEVILDVVFNHTTEGGTDGPTICFRGLANPTYYILDEDRSRYADYTGCSNTLNANEPIVRRLILDSLHYWVTEMHVDGFRFDLASILSRDQDGRPMASPPILWDIESDPVLANVKLIAEAWDAAGLYQVGSFVGDSWKEWNGQFRDDLRSFLKGDNGMVRALAYRLSGSPDIYEHEQREAEQSINFVTCHDGFTLNDVVSFNGKHNEANREGNRDGADQNPTWKLRDRRHYRQPGCRAAPPAADQEFPDPDRAGNRDADATDGRRGAAQPGAATTTPSARTTKPRGSKLDATQETHADLHRFTKQLIALRNNPQSADANGLSTSR